MRPFDLNVRMYNVGHGDCFLLTFRYQKESRHLLIDFGTLQPNRIEERSRLMPIAADITQKCGGKLHAIVATHAHRDHIGGFEQLRRSNAPGNMIAKLKPQLVVLPATRPVVNILDDVYTALTGSCFSNHRALEDLKQLGKTAYVQAKRKTGLEKIFQGVRFHALGPRPLIAHSRLPLNGLLDSETQLMLEFWTAEHRALQQKHRRPIFPHAAQLLPRLAPPSTRWLIERLSRLRDDQLLSLAQMIHTEINNSSIILLIEFGGHQLLFPGDAEKAAWSPILTDPLTCRMISETTVYKASHHGSINGTPSALSEIFRRKVITLLSSRNAKMRNPLGRRLPTIDTRHLQAKGSLSADLHLEPIDFRKRAA